MRRLQALTLLVLALSSISALPQIYTAAAGANVSAQRRRAQRRAPAPQTRRPAIDYTKFSHRTAQHKIDCASCHQIPTDNWRTARAQEPYPDVADYPDHAACLRCHKQQFFRGARPAICAVCHTKVSPRDDARFDFPKLGRTRERTTPTQFATIFPHDKHQDVMAERRRGPSTSVESFFVRASFQQNATPQQQKPIDSCSICHETYEPQGQSDVEEMSGRPKEVDPSLWPKKGSFKTTPTDHASCFNCHWKEGGAAPFSSNCAACHKLLDVNRADTASKGRGDADLSVAAHVIPVVLREKLLRRESVRFRHEVEKHEGIGCTGCHINITSINTLDPASLEVSILTCGGTGTSCHIKPRPKAILNVEVDKKRADANFQCIKCHVRFGREGVPKSHSDPVPLPKP